MKWWQKGIMMCSGAFAYMAILDFLSLQNFWMVVDTALAIGTYKLATIEVK